MSAIDYKASYERWLSESSVDAETKAELLAIADNDEEIKQRFISYLSFGTAGLRGTMNAGTNAMNVYTVAHATQGMATLICGKGEEAMKRGVVIAHDCRINARTFAEVSSEITRLTTSGWYDLTTPSLFLISLTICGRILSPPFITALIAVMS